MVPVMRGSAGTAGGRTIRHNDHTVHRLRLQGGCDCETATGCGCEAVVIARSAHPLPGPVEPAIAALLQDFLDRSALCVDRVERRYAEDRQMRSIRRPGHRRLVFLDI